MSGSKGLFVRQNGAVGTTPVEGRRALAGLFYRNSATTPRSGLLNPPNTVVSATAGWSYSVVPINPIISRTADEGVYDFTFEGTTTVSTTVAPGADSRWDLIYVKHNDIEKSDADNLPVLGVVQGTASASPSKPTGSLPSGALVLAEARIYAGSTSTQDALNSLTQVFPYQAVAGTPLKVRNLADRNTITQPYLGMQVIRMDRDNHVQTYTGVGTSGWEWTSKPTRVYWDETISGTATSASSRLLDTMPDDYKSYARRVSLGGQMTMTCGAIGSGSKSVYLSVSVNSATAAGAQSRSAFSWVAPGAYLQTQPIAQSNNILLGSGINVLFRVWIEDLGGSVTTTPSVSDTLTNLWYEWLPEAD